MSSSLARILRLDFEIDIFHYFTLLYNKFLYWIGISLPFLSPFICLLWALRAPLIVRSKKRGIAY